MTPLATPFEDLFDLTQTAHAEIFDGIEQYHWEVLPLIAEYIEYALEHAQVLSETAKAAFVGPRVAIGKNCIIEPGAVILGPALIGNECHIRSGAYIRENVIIGNGCTIGNSTEIKNSLLFNDVSVPHFNYIGDSILGYRVHLGAGVVISNVKTPPAPIKITTLHGSIDTGLRKFGALVGDETEIGANSVLNPGTIIGKRCSIYPLSSVRGVVNADSIVKLRQQQEIAIKRTQYGE